MTQGCAVARLIGGDRPPPPPSGADQAAISFEGQPALFACRFPMGAAAMNAAEALEAARAAGIQIKIDDDLLPKASAPPPPGVLDGLSRHKARILMLLRPGKRVI
jgi:hypothetical protein